MSAAKAQAEARHADIPGESVTKTHTATVETVHTEVKNTATNEILSQEIKIDKIESDDDGIISQSHFEAKIEKDDTQGIDDEPAVPEIEDGGPETDYKAAAEEMGDGTWAWTQLAAYFILFSIVISYAVHCAIYYSVQRT